MLRVVAPNTLSIAALAFALAVPRAGAQESQTKGGLVEGLRCAVDPTQTYTLYLPTSYDPARSWPAMLVLDPRGRSVLAAEVFREAAERYGWILLSSNDTRSDVSSAPNRKALTALWPEARNRYSTDAKRIYAAGFSGTVIAAWGLGLGTNELAGVISACGRLDDSSKGKPVTFAQFSATGNADFNYLATLDMDAYLEKAGAPHRLAVYAGPHSWMPAETATRAVEWLEALAMAQGRREKDAGLAKQLHDRELERARAVEAAGDLRAALESYRALASTFAGLSPTDEATQRAAALTAGSAYKEAERDAAAARRYEEVQLATARRAFSAWQASDPIQPAGPLAVNLGIAGLQKQASEPTARGDAAKRVLAAIEVQTGFYMPRDFQAQKRYEEAAILMEVASEIHPGQPVALYNLACAQALAGARKKALATLRKSVEAGFRDAAQMEADPDLATLRGEKGFSELLAGLKGGA